MDRIHLSQNKVRFLVLVKTKLKINFPEWGCGDIFLNFAQLLAYQEMTVLTGVSVGLFCTLVTSSRSCTYIFGAARNSTGKKTLCNKTGILNFRINII